MNQDWHCGIEELAGMLDAATCIEQLATLVTDADIETKIVIVLKILDYLSGEMMHVHHNACEPGIMQTRNDTPQEGLTPHFDERLWLRVCDGLQPCT